MSPRRSMPRPDGTVPGKQTWIIPEASRIHDSGITGSFFIPRDSLWFSGHFPDMPLLPAIGMLGMVYDTLAAYASHNSMHLILREMKRVRFKKILRPESDFSVSLALQPSGDGFSGSFQCTSGGDTVCEGMLSLGREQAPGEP